MRANRLFLIALVSASAACSGTESITAAAPGTARAAKGGNGTDDGATTTTTTLGTSSTTTSRLLPGDSIGTTDSYGGFLGSGR